MLATATTTALALGGCQSSTFPEVIDLGVIPSASDVGVCPPDEAGYHNRGVSCYDGIQVVALGSWHGEMRGQVPAATSETSDGLKATLRLGSYGAISDGSNLPLSPFGDFELHGCDRPEAITVTSPSDGVDVALQHAASVGSGLRFVAGIESRTPPFTYGLVELSGPALGELPPEDVSLRFDGPSPSCQATIVVPAKYLVALGQWAQASNDYDKRWRAEMNQ